MKIEGFGDTKSFDYDCPICGAKADRGPRIANGPATPEGRGWAAARAAAWYFAHRCSRRVLAAIDAAHDRAGDGPSEFAIQRPLNERLQAGLRQMFGEESGHTEG